MTAPRTLSAGEEGFLLHCRIYHLTPEREYRFDPERRWRIDFCFPAERLAIEIEGGVWQRGRHVRPLGFTRDIEKANALALAGYRLLRFTTQQVQSGYAIDTVMRALGKEVLTEAR